MSDASHPPAADAGPVVDADRDGREAVLLLRLQGGDRDALQALYEGLATPVTSLAFALLGTREEAEEVVQDAFVQLYRQAARFDPARGTVRAFIYAIARNACLSLLRKRSARPRASDHDPHAPAVGHDVRFASRDPDVVTRVTLEQALAEIGEPDRTLIMHVYFDGFSHRDLAAETGMPLGTLKSRIRRGLGRLRALLEGE